MSCFTPTRSASPQGLLTGLPALGADGFEFPGTSSDSQDGTVSWEAPVATCVMKTLSGRLGDGDTARTGLRVPQGGSEGDTTLPSSFQSVQDPGTPGRPALSAASFASFSVVLLSVPRTCRPDGQWW